MNFIFLLDFINTMELLFLILNFFLRKLKLAQNFQKNYKVKTD